MEEEIRVWRFFLRRAVQRLATWTIPHLEHAGAGTRSDSSEPCVCAGRVALSLLIFMGEIARRLNVKLEWADIPFDSLMAAVKAGKIDLAISAFNYSAERALEIDFSDPYYLSEDAWVVTDQFSGTIVAPQDVRRYRVGVQSGSTQENWLVENLVKPGKLPETSLFRYERADQAAEALKNGRIEVWMADNLPAQVFANQLGNLETVYKGTLSGGPLHIVLRKDDPSLKAEINRIIQDLESQGFIKQLALQYIARIK